MLNSRTGQNLKRKMRAQELSSIASSLGVDLGKPQPSRPLLYGADGAPLPSGPQPLKFTEIKYEYFDVEFADRADDIIYHFWPPNDGDQFVRGFSKALEQGFKTTLPASADVRADYTSKEESAVLSRHAEFEVRLDKESRSTSSEKWIPRETYFVRVVGGAQYPLAEVFLKHRVFDNITQAIQATRS